MSLCFFLGIVAVLLYPSSLFIFSIVADFDKTSQPPKDDATYWERSLDANKRDLPMIYFGYVLAVGLFALAIYLTFFSCAFNA